ncbi:hypothetical protein [Bradyrhizobium sp. 168]|uniref:hypothetical protein n=1 Tax=Bradyrhizobium sp. 168 TaxID=2782639 RepID=UPI001FF978CF|nr:hypothetical protein [Bradyrhizobium sp. 168]
MRITPFAYDCRVSAPAKAASTSNFGYLRFIPFRTSSAWATDPAFTWILSPLGVSVRLIRPSHFQLTAGIQQEVLTGSGDDRHAQSASALTLYAEMESQRPKLLLKRRIPSVT